MIGDTPQPGETPRTEGDPWSFADPDAAWWRGDTERSGGDAPTGRPRHPRRRQPQHQPAAAAGGTGTLEPPQTERQRTGEEAEAHAAATRDVAVQLNRTVVDPPAVERDHDQPDPHRYDPLKPPAGYRSRLAPVEERPEPEITPAAEAQPASAEARPTPAPTADVLTTRTPHVEVPRAETPTAETPQAEVPQAGTPVTQTPQADTPQAETLQAETTQAEGSAVEGPQAEQELGPLQKAEPELKAEGPEVEPDVMVLPDPDDRTRPTVALERSPAQLPAPVPPPPPPTVRPRQVPQSPEPAGNRPTEPLPRNTGSPIIDARLEKLENSPFWQDRHEDALIADRATHPGPRHIASHRGRSTRRPLSAQVTMITLGLVAAFFAWVSAEPFWLAVGHGDRGYATTTSCTGDSVTQRCTGRFASADGRYTISNITLLGVEQAGREAGSTAPARMVSPDSRQAYLGGTGWLLHLRWLLGFALILVCGYGIAGATGARRLENARARRTAVLLSLAGPLSLLAGFLAAAY